LKNLTLITGGARSGKSGFAEDLALQSKQTVYYLATMPYIAGDVEQEERIQQHKLRRPESWQTIECEENLHTAIAELPDGKAFCIIDCISLYVSNLFFSFEKQGGALWRQQDTIIPSLKSKERPVATKRTRFQALDKMVRKSVTALIASAENRPEKTFVVVTNEVGMGIIPDNEMSRRYRDYLGETNKELAQAAQTVWLCCSGLKLKLK
jgi:adenosylcobinamide kinase / adenosylcobinamide-phosphate guanylyltransferase